MTERRGKYLNSLLEDSDDCREPAEINKLPPLGQSLPRPRYKARSLLLLPLILFPSIQFTCSSPTTIATPIPQRREISPLSPYEKAEAFLVLSFDFMRFSGNQALQSAEQTISQLQKRNLMTDGSEGLNFSLDDDPSKEKSFISAWKIVYHRREKTVTATIMVNPAKVESREVIATDLFIIAQELDYVFSLDEASLLDYSGNIDRRTRVLASILERFVKEIYPEYHTAYQGTRFQEIAQRYHQFSSLPDFDERWLDYIKILFYKLTPQMSKMESPINRSARRFPPPSRAPLPGWQARGWRRI